MATVTSSKRHLLVTSDTYTSNGDVTVGGDLYVNGSQTTINTTTLSVEDRNITLNYGGTASSSQGAGITITGSNATLLWDHANTKWTLSDGLSVSGNISASNLSGTNTGDQDLSGYALTSHNHDSRYIRLDTATTPTNKVTFGYGVTDLNNVGGGHGVTGFRSTFQASNKPGSGNYATGVEFTYHDTGARTQFVAASSGQNTTPELWVRGEAWGSTPSWGDWYQIYHENHKPTPAEIGAQPAGNYETDDGTGDRYVFKVDLGNLSNVTRWYKVATVNQGSGGLLMRGSLTNHVESFGSTKFDLTIQGREANASDQIEITGSIDVFDDNTGVYIVKSVVSGSYTTYDVYIECYNYTQAWVELIKTGITGFDTSGNYVTTAPSGLVELDTSTYSEGSYTIIDSENRFSIKKISSGTTAISGNAVSNAVLRIGANYQNQIYMDGSTVYINDDMETERIYINTCDTNTTSTTALVLNNTEVEKRTLGSAAFANVGDFATSGHSHSEYLRSDANDTGTGIITLSQNNSTTPYPLIVKNVSNANGVGIEFDDNLNGTQRGYITHFHSDTKSYGSGASLILSSTESTTTILADGKLMYGEGVYSKPASGTGAGTRKDQNWDTAYTHSQSAHAPANAEQNVQSDWNATSGDAFIQNKPSIPAASAKGASQNYVASSTSTSNRGNYGAGVWAYSGYSTGSNRPFTYDATLQVMPTSGLGFEMSTGWHSTDEGKLRIRALRDCCEGWGNYYDVWTSANFSQTDINEWNNAVDNHITGIAVTGTSTKTITLTQNDGGTISANFTDNSGSAATEFSYTIDMSNTSTYAETTYYPVTIPISQARLYKFKIENALNTNVPGWSTHSSGFSLLLEYTTHGNGWGTHYQNRYISLWSERYANVTILGGITQMTNSSNEVLWLRGGGRYNLKSNVSGLTVTPRSSTYTASSQSVSPQTSVVNDVYSSADGIFAVDSLKAISQFVTGSSFLTTLNVSGNSYLGDGNGDQTIINDTLYLGASDSGDSHFYFGENSSNWYGEHWYWDSGYETERYSRHAGTDSLIEKHDTRYTHKIQTNRGYERLGHSTGYQIGSYNSVGGNSSKTNPIYVIGDNYRPTDTSIAGMYGIGYAHDNLWGSGKSNGWGFYVAENGSFTQTLTNNGLWSAGTITSANQGTLYGTSNIPNFLRADTQDAYTPKRIDFGASSGWDAVGFGNATNLHVQGHNQFWFGAGNGTWFTGTANTKSSTSGLAADASNAHDLLISTMQATATTDRGITFAVDSGGAGTSGWRLGKWHSSNSQASSKLTIDGGLHVRGGDMANYDYYADDYSTYWDNQAGGAYWTGDTGWIDPSITAGNAIQIQAGNAATNSNNPALQFHQYGYGGVQLRYNGPSDVMHLESTGSSRYDYFENKTDHGYIQIGPMNTSHAHIYTDRSNFYFNKEIRVLGGCTVKQTEFSLGSGHKVIWNNGYGNPYIQDYYGSININAPLYLGASGTASQNLYAAGVYVNNNTVWHAGSTGLGGTNRISDLSNANNSVPSGFYQYYNGSNYPTTGTWYNLLNVRHSNTGNDHGFQIAASYYNEDIFTRTYQGGSGANNGVYTTWRRLYHEGHKPTLSELGAAASSHTHTPSQVGLGNLSSSGNSLSGAFSASSNITTTGGHFYGRSVNGTYSNIYRMGGIYFTWDSDSYGTNTHHSIRSTYGDSYGDDLTINSYHHLRINIDSNNNNTDEKFEIGQNTTGTGNVRFRVLGTGAVYAANDIVAYYSFSDERLKTDIKPTTDNLDKVLKLEPVEYSWKDGSRDGKKEIGLIAQDVEKVVPEVVRENTRLSDDDDTLYKQVDYEHLVSTLIGAVQEQQDQIELLKAEIEELKNK